MSDKDMTPADVGFMLGGMQTIKITMEDVPRTKEVLLILKMVGVAEDLARQLIKVMAERDALKVRA